jgi:hypothetical protein
VTGIGRAVEALGALVLLSVWLVALAVAIVCACDDQLGPRRRAAAGVLAFALCAAPVANCLLPGPTP